MRERAGNTSQPRWWKQTEQYLCELMRIKNNLFEQNEKCKKGAHRGLFYTVPFIKPAWVIKF